MIKLTGKLSSIAMDRSPLGVWIDISVGQFHYSVNYAMLFNKMHVGWKLKKSVEVGQKTIALLVACE